MQAKSGKTGQVERAGQKSTQGYRWMSKDPIIDEVMALCKCDGRSLSAIAREAWLSPQTLLNWDHGKTKKPNNVSIEFTLRALGYERRIVKADAASGTVYRWKTP